MQNLREAAQQALNALEMGCTDHDGNPVDLVGPAITALRAALAQPEPRNQCGETCERAKLCAVCARGIAEDAMQRLTDVQQEMDCYGDGNVYRGKRSSDSKTPTLTINGMPAITALRAALAKDRSGDTGKTSDHFADAGKMVANINEIETVEPVAWIGCLEGGIEYGTYHKAALKLPDGVRFNLYAAPPKRKPLTDEDIDVLRQGEQRLNFVTLREFRVIARAIERAHGIGGDE